MKKVIISFLCVSLIFTLFSCNNKKAKEVKEEVNEETTKEVTKQEVVEEVKPEESTVVEETKEDTSTPKVIKAEDNTQDIEDMFFWVVFYDQYGCELQREALKYGTTPEYKEWLPEGFDNWIYKRSGTKVNGFVPITGNTYFQAECHEVHHEHHDSHEPSGPTINEVVLWEGEVTVDGYASDVPPFLSDGGTELQSQGAKAGDVICFYIHATDITQWEVQVFEGHWSPKYKEFIDANHTDPAKESVETDASDNAILRLTLTQEMLDALCTAQYWGGTFVLMGDNVVCKKITLIKN